MVDASLVGELVSVIWMDAHASVQQEMTADEIAQEEPVTYTSHGILVRLDNVFAAVAADRRDDGRFRGITFIPRGMVSDIKAARPRRKPKVKPAAETPADGH